MKKTDIQRYGAITLPRTSQFVDLSSEENQKKNAKLPAKIYPLQLRASKIPTLRTIALKSLTM